MFQVLSALRPSQPSLARPTHQGKDAPGHLPLMWMQSWRSCAGEPRCRSSESVDEHRRCSSCTTWWKLSCSNNSKTVCHCCFSSYCLIRIWGQTSWSSEWCQVILASSNPSNVYDYTCGILFWSNCVFSGGVVWQVGAGWDVFGWQEEIHQGRSCAVPLRSLISSVLNVWNDQVLCGKKAVLRDVCLRLGLKLVHMHRIAQAMTVEKLDQELWDSGCEICADWIRISCTLCTGSWFMSIYWPTTEAGSSRLLSLACSMWTCVAYLKFCVSQMGSVHIPCCLRSHHWKLCVQQLQQQNLVQATYLLCNFTNCISIVLCLGPVSTRNVGQGEATRS